MDFASRGEKEVSRLEWLAARGADVLTAALNYDIDFVSRMWLLRIDLLWRVDLNLESAVTENCRKGFSFRSGQLRKSLVNSDSSFRILF